MERGKALALAAGVILAGAGLMGCEGEFTGVDDGRLVTTPQSLELSAIGEEAQLEAWATDGTGDTVTVSVQWSSRDPAVAEVLGGGLVRATGNGTTYIVGSAGEGTDSVRVRVDQVAASLAVTPHADTLFAVGDSIQLQAAALDANGHPVPDEEITWASKQPGIAEVDGMGRILARSAGVAMITASVVCCGDSASVVVDPKVPTLQTVQVAPGNASIAESGTQQFTATAIDSEGNPMDGVSFTWSSQHTDVATVNNQGMATAKAAGTTTISASSGGKSGSATLTVNTVVVNGPSISLNPSNKLQVMSGWEATAQAGHESPSFDTWKNEVFNRAVDELGINRLRLPVRAGAESDTDYYALYRNGTIDNATWKCARYATVNDNSDPNARNNSGFHFTELDFIIDQIIIPMRQRLSARGEDLYLNLNYTAFTDQICSGYNYHHLNPDEYAEFILAAFDHMKSKYGFVPDAVEIILEPDNSTGTYPWTGQKVGGALVATESRLSAAGYSPDYIAPSTSTMETKYFDAMVQSHPAAANIVDELAYHRYRGNESTSLPAIASRVAQYDIRSAMLEHIRSDYLDLHNDITVAKASAWQQFTLAFPTTDNGAQYFYIQNGQVRISETAKFFQQYFRFVRLWAQRIGASSTSSKLSPLAFINTDGSYAVVVKANGGESFSVQGLPGGTYGITYTTATEYAANLADVTISGGQPLQASIPAAGVITIYRK